MAISATSGISVPIGRIGNVRISRLICGGNLVIGSAHDRDLLYVASLMRHYFTDRKIMETWRLCEECGVNTMIGPVNSPYAFGEDPTLRMYRRYREEWGGLRQRRHVRFPGARGRDSGEGHRRRAPRTRPTQAMERVARPGNRSVPDTSPYDPRTSPMSTLIKMADIVIVD